MQQLPKKERRMKRIQPKEVQIKRRKRTDVSIK